MKLTVQREFRYLNGQISQSEGRSLSTHVEGTPNTDFRNHGKFSGSVAKQAQMME